MLNIVCRDCGAIVSDGTTHTFEDCKKWKQMLIDEEIKRNLGALKNPKNLST